MTETKNILTDSWVVRDSVTGAYDGCYRRKEMAEDALASLSKRVPQAAWKLEQYSGFPLSDNMFWANFFKGQYDV
jgi:hypothetical protein